MELESIHEREICNYYFSPIILSHAYTHTCGYINTIVWTFFGYIYWTKNSLVSSDKIYIPIQNVQLKSKRVLPTFAQVGAKCVICEFPFFCTNKTNPPRYTLHDFKFWPSQTFCNAMVLSFNRHEKNTYVIQEACRMSQWCRWWRKQTPKRNQIALKSQDKLLTFFLCFFFSFHTTLLCLPESSSQSQPPATEPWSVASLHLSSADVSFCFPS